MKVSPFILAYWITSLISAVWAGVQIPSLVIHNTRLHRRAPAGKRPSGQTLLRPPKLQAEVKVKGNTVPFEGSTFTKNEHGKLALAGQDAVSRKIWSGQKVSAGGTQWQGQNKLIAEASGKNVAVHLDFPKGSKGSYTIMGSGGKIKHIVDYTQSPFSLELPPEENWTQMTAAAKVKGPGSVKAKAWN